MSVAAVGAAYAFPADPASVCAWSDDHGMRIPWAEVGDSPREVCVVGCGCTAWRSALRRVLPLPTWTVG